MKTTLALWVLIILSVSCAAPTPAEQAEAEHSEESTTVEMSLEAQTHMGLQVTTAEVELLREYLSVTGTVQPVDSQSGHIRPLAGGILATVSAAIGDRVAAGQPLATYDNVDASGAAYQYRTAMAELEQTHVQLAVAQQQTERSRQLADIGAIPRKEHELRLGEQRSIEAAIKTRESVLSGLAATLRRFGLAPENLSATIPPTVIRAPFAGIVIKANAAPGEVVASGEELFQIADLSRVWVQAEVYEKDLGRIQIGQSASIAVDTYPDRDFSGVVRYISDTLDPQTRTARVRCEVENPKGMLKVDMFATVRLPTTFSQRALVVPVDSIQQIDGSNVVFVRTGETTFDRKVIEIGRSVQGKTEVLSGLAADDTVVTKGAFHLKSIVLGEEIGEEH